MVRCSVVSVFDGVEFLDVEVDAFDEVHIRRALSRLPQFSSDDDLDMLGELVASGPVSMLFQLWGGPSVPVAHTIVTVG